VARLTVSSADGAPLGLQMLPGQGAFHAFGVVGNHGQIGAGWLVGLAASLFPIAQRSERDMIPHRKFFLCHSKGPAQGLSRGSRRAVRSRSVVIGRASGSFIAFIGHSPNPRPIRFVFQRLGGAVRQHLNKGSVTPPFGYDSIPIAHASSLFWLR
jgi:hypothetical protein